MILCLGTTPAVQRVLVFPHLTLGQVNRAAEVHVGSAGKLINVAKVVHSLGVPMQALGFLGGTTGELIADEFCRLGVNSDFVKAASPTRVCVTVIDRATAAITELVEEAGAVTAGEWDSLTTRFRQTLKKTKLLVLSGSLAPGASPDFYAQCITAAHAAGIQVILDAQGEPLRRALGCRPLVVKPNRAELAATIGRAVDSEADLHDAVRKLIDMGPQWAVITMGEAGVLISNGKHFWRISPPKITAVNPIGSGDAFAAGLAVSLMEGKPLPEAALLAVACGASNAMDILPGKINLQDVRRFVADLQVLPADL